MVEERFGTPDAFECSMRSMARSRRMAISFREHPSVRMGDCGLRTRASCRSSIRITSAAIRVPPPVQIEQVDRRSHDLSVRKTRAPSAELARPADRLHGPESRRSAQDALPLSARRSRHRVAGRRHATPGLLHGPASRATTCFRSPQATTMVSGTGAARALPSRSRPRSTRRARSRCSAFSPRSARCGCCSCSG